MPAVDPSRDPAPARSVQRAVAPGRVAVVLALAALSTGAAGDRRPPTPGPTGPARPNIILITLDTTRADVLGSYGGDPKVSRNLDRIAGRSHLFERCSASVPQTLPSHTTILSGLEPFHHGVRKNLATVVGPEVPLLAEELHRIGYATGAFVSSFVVDGRFGFERGFDVYDAPDRNPNGGDGMERRAADTVKRAIAWLDGRSEPWFCWVHLFDPHAPYEAPEPFRSRFADRPYAAEVAYMDNEAGRLVGALVASRRFDDSLVILAGDHGEALGEHGEPTHGILLYEATTRVPLVIHMPGQTEAARHPQPVGLVDVAATVRELVGIETASDGRSLLPVLRGDAELPADRSIYIESLEGFLRSGWAPLYAIVHGRWKYIHSPRPELYDVVADPGERRDLAADRSDLVDDLERRLTAIRPSDDDVGHEEVDLDPDQQAALLALGYIAGSPGAGAGSRRNPVDMIHLVELHERALEARTRGDLDTAAALFEEELDADPDSPVVLWYLGTCEAPSSPERAAARFRRAIELRPEFEPPYASLVELALRAEDASRAVAIADRGIERTSDSTGDLHMLRAAAASVTDGNTDRILGDLAIAIERAARPGPAYLLRAAVRLERLDDPDGALVDLERYADWSTSDDVARLRHDPRFGPLHQRPRFRALVGDDDAP